MSGVYTGLVLISICSMLTIAMLIVILLKILKLKKRGFDRIYKNKGIIVWFYILHFLFIPLLFAACITLVILIINQNQQNQENENLLNSYKLTFNILYLSYIVFIFINLLVGERLFKNMLITEKDGTYFFLNNKHVSKNMIISITPNEKKTIIILNYLDDNHKQTIYILKFSNLLFSWLNGKTDEKT